MNIDEILDIIESIYKKEEYPELIKVLWNLGHNILPEDVKIIQPLIDKNIIKKQNSIYVYSDLAKEYGKNINLYIHRQVELKSNYYFDDEKECHLPKDDYIANLLKSRGVNIKVKNPEELFTYTVNVDLTPTFNNRIQQSIKGIQKESEPVKSYLITLLLCIALGWLGIHRFYVGKKNTAVKMLIFGILSGFLVSFIWEFVDIYLILTNKFKTAAGNDLDRGQDG